MSYRTPEIRNNARKEAAKELLPAVMQWLKSEGDEHDEAAILQDLETLLVGNYDLDGYALARDLDDWNANAELVEILDDAAYLISKAERKLLKQYLHENDINPKLKKGTEVNVPGRYLTGWGSKNIDRNRIYAGKIISIESEGTYSVYSEEAGHVTFESGKTGVTATHVPWHELEDANPDLILQHSQKSDIV